MGTHSFFEKKNHVLPPSQKIQNCLKLAQKRTQKKRTKRGLAVLLQLPTKLVLRKITKESFVLETLLVPGEESTTAGCLGGKVPVQLRAATSSVQRRRPTTLVALLPTFNFFALLSRHHEPRHLLQLADKLKPYMKTGIPSLNIPKTDPMDIDKIAFQLKNPLGVVTVKFTENTVEGLSTHTINSIRANK